MTAITVNVAWRTTGHYFLYSSAPIVGTVITLSRWLGFGSVSPGSYKAGSGGL